MRRVSISHQATERLLELFTFDVMAKRRTPIVATSMMRAFDEFYRSLQDETVRLRNIGTAARRFGVFPNNWRRIVNLRFSAGALAVTISIDRDSDECVVESIELV